MDADLHYQWGYPSSYSEVVLSHKACDEVVYTNRLTSFVADEISFILGGHTFLVVHGDGTEPDTLYVVPAVGWVQPEPLQLDEGETGTLQICPMGLS